MSSANIVDVTGASNRIWPKLPVKPDGNTSVIATIRNVPADKYSMKHVAFSSRVRHIITQCHMKAAMLTVPTLMQGDRFVTVDHRGTIYVFHIDQNR